METEVGEQLAKNPNLKCHVCGENQFDEREGYYYCQECGTKQDQLRVVEVEENFDFDQEKLRAKKQKIILPKTEKPQLTSWECYNYILRGFVEELLLLGAKEELKLMTLQVWAAYLGRMQVAFFSRKQADLPKLGIKYLQNDAKTIYNHTKQNIKKRRQRSSVDANCPSRNGSQSSRNWSRSKRKLDESNYSQTSGDTGFTSSTSAKSNRAIRLEFNVKAKSFLKRQMPLRHIQKHTADAEGLLKCHKQPKYREINRTDYNLMLLNTRQICAILAIALNLIGDDIQLCDLVRFINEKHISGSNALQYFPENIAIHGKEILASINFYKCADKFSDKSLRDHIGTLCKNIGIHTLMRPDIIKLIQRYTTELCLPAEFANYIESLINLVPPAFNTRVDGYYPGYEARAMAYIIFTMKLFFGLDGSKEHRMSRATKVLNTKLEQLNRKSNVKQPLLFVWSEWMEYIEMRKVIISQFSTSFCEQYKQCQSTNQVIEQMAEEMRLTEERNILLNTKSEHQSFVHKMNSFKSILERFEENYKQQSAEGIKQPVLIDFRPSLTPALSYFKSILLFCNNESNTNSSPNVKIPDFMQIDHSQRDINSFCEVKPLIGYFRRHQRNLKVHVLGTTKNRQHVGIFRSPVLLNKNRETMFRACVEVTEEEWDELVGDRGTESADDLQFYTDFQGYTESYYNRMIRVKQFFNPAMNYNLNLLNNDTINTSRENEDVPEMQEPLSSSMQCKNVISSKEQVRQELQSMHSFEIFSENNMDPIDREDFITSPRRNLDEINLFEGISDEESVLNDDDGIEDINTMDNNTAATSMEENNYTPPILGGFIKLEPVSPRRPELKMPSPKQNTIPETDDGNLKFYISNMDCWMMLGNILKLTNAQKSQLQDKFPRSFNWLLETCAQTIGVEWPAVFEQLICLEAILCLGINDPQTITNCVYTSLQNPNKELQTIINNCREIW